MARVTYVKKAQQRYRTVPLIDPETGEQKKVPVMRKDGTQKTTRAKAGREGRLVFRRLTVEDKTQPLPNHTCDRCRKEIEVGQPYKWIAPKSGPYGGSKRYRCAACPTWQVWEYSSSLGARTAQIAHDFQEAISAADEQGTVEEALQAAAEEVRNLAEEKREGASNIEDGFGHPTSTSEELENVADELDSWADEIEGVDVPETPDPEEGECGTCDGTGKIDCPDSGDDHNAECTRESCDGEMFDCDECDGSGNNTSGEPTEAQMWQWLQEVEDAVSIVDECPV